MKKYIVISILAMLLASCVTDTTAMIAAEVNQNVLFTDQSESLIQLIQQSDLPDGQKTLLLGEIQNMADQFQALTFRQTEWLENLGEFDWDTLKDDLLNEMPREAILRIIQPPEGSL